LSREILIVYHEPGVRGSEERLRRILHLLRANGIEARLSALTEAVDNSCWGARLVYLLMMGRGGHWLELKEACGVDASVIPGWVVAKSIAEYLSPRGARSVLLLYRRAKRNVDVYTRDLEGIAVGLRALDYMVVMLEASMVERTQLSVDAVVPLTLLPGSLTRLARKAARLYSALHAAPYFALYGLENIASWIAADVTSHAPV